MSAQTDLSAQAKQSLAYSYAALLLSDAELDISASNLDALVKATNNTVSAALSKVFAKALEGKNPQDFFACGGAPAAAAGGAAAGGDAKASAPAKEEKAEEEEEGDFDMGDMFG